MTRRVVVVVAGWIMAWLVCSAGFGLAYQLGGLSPLWGLAWGWSGLLGLLGWSVARRALRGFARGGEMRRHEDDAAWLANLDRRNRVLVDEDDALADEDDDAEDWIPRWTITGTAADGKPVHGTWQTRYGVGGADWWAAKFTAEGADVRVVPFGREADMSDEVYTAPALWAAANAPAVRPWSGRIPRGDDTSPNLRPVLGDPATWRHPDDLADAPTQDPNH